jgi:glyoxylase-like metal-dependent hydrolase (beta-lactamase superfamily II)
MNVLVINDTGVGTSIFCHPTESSGHDWNIASFIEHNFNPNGDLPYLCILSHCHYDHILGLKYLLHIKPGQVAAAAQNQREVSIVSSSFARSFTTPYEVLMEHSLCNSEGLHAPSYQTSIWAGDDEHIVYRHPSGSMLNMNLPIITLHTPGHTPDSLSWYDLKERVIYVGDSFYEKESTDTREAPWGPERSASILFPKEGDLLSWWRSLEKLSAFVKARNAEENKIVTLAAGHVTISVDAQECLVDVKRFMAKVLRGEARFEEQPLKREERFGHWTDTKQDSASGGFSLGAPLRIIHEGRERIPKVEWDNSELKL